MLVPPAVRALAAVLVLSHVHTAAAHAAAPTGVQEPPLSTKAWTSTGQLLESYGYVHAPTNKIVEGDGEIIWLAAYMILGPPPTYRGADRLIAVECSDAMAQPQPSLAIDANLDGLPGTLLDAVVETIAADATVGFDSTLFAYPTAVALFGADVGFADVLPSAGTSVRTQDHQNGLQLPQVARSLRLPGDGPEIGLHTPVDVAPGADYEALLEAAITHFAGFGHGRPELILFAATPLADPSVLDDELAALAGLGVVARCYGLGAAAQVLCAPTGVLGHVAAATGGTAEPVLVGALGHVTPQPADVVTFEDAWAFGCDNDAPGKWWQWGPCAPFCSDSFYQSVTYWEHCFHDSIGTDDLGPGEHVFEWYAVASDGTKAGGSTTVTVLPKFEEFMAIGLAPTAVPVGPSDANVLFVEPLLFLPVTGGSSPEFTIPYVPGLQGREIYFQVAIVDNRHGTAAPLRTSNGIELTINAGAANYGLGSLLDAWFEGSFKMGECFRIRYVAPGLEDE